MGLYRSSIFLGVHNGIILDIYILIIELHMTLTVDVNQFWRIPPTPIVNIGQILSTFGGHFFAMLLDEIIIVWEK